MDSSQLLESITLSNGETIETKLDEDKQEETEQAIEETSIIEPKKESIFDKIINFFKGVFGF